jgi:hypothetical protein
MSNTTAQPITARMKLMSPRLTGSIGVASADTCAFVRVSPKDEILGRITRKYRKYSPVKSLLAPTYGAAAAREPRNIRVRNTPTKSQKKIL